MGPDRARATQLELREVRSYRIPANFKPKGASIRSTRAARTLLAATTGTGEKAFCTVVVADARSARAYPYRHADEGSRCIGVAPGPAGGFFVRGFGAGSSEGEVAGFLARIDGAGRERWILSDATIAADSNFRGSYRIPRAPMAYLGSSGRLLAFTGGSLQLGMLEQRKVTYASVVRDGEFERPAETLGSSAGFGVVGALEALRQTGEFLIAIRRPATGSSQLLIYDGVQNVDEFEPLGENWESRFVRDLDVTADGAIHLLWTSDADGATTHVTVAERNGDEFWSQSYPLEVELNDMQTTLGPPRALRAGSKYVAVWYRPKSPVLRLVDAGSGASLGVFGLPGATPHRPLGIVHGSRGALRLLTADTSGNRFREYRISVPAENGDTGPTDRDTGVGEEADAGDTGGRTENGGCSIAGTPERPPLAGLAVLLLAAGGRLRRLCKRRR